MIELQPSHKECFFEDLNPGDQVSTLFAVAKLQKIVAYTCDEKERY